MSNAVQILIVDDTESLLLPIVDLLCLEGYECNYVPDTETVIEILKCVKFDLLIADINMVGCSVLETIKGLSGNVKELPIIMVTGAPLSKMQLQSVKPFAITCLSKPISSEELLKHVRCSVTSKLIGA